MEAEATKVVSASIEVAAPADLVFELIADPSRQPEWDGNDNLARAPIGQRVRSVGEVFSMELTLGSIRECHVVEFEEGCRIAWLPAEPGGAPIGHLWRWQIEPIEGDHCLVTHTYDWTNLHDPNRLARARQTTTDRLAASAMRLAALAEREA